MKNKRLRDLIVLSIVVLIYAAIIHMAVACLAFKCPCFVTLLIVLHLFDLAVVGFLIIPNKIIKDNRIKFLFWCAKIIALPSEKAIIKDESIRGSYKQGIVHARFRNTRGPNRNMKLLSQIWFRFKAYDWKADINSKFDGASIPPIFWLVIGSPFVGDYRRASIVHDVYCDPDSKARKEVSSDDVHEMFYYAMRNDGVDQPLAAVMYMSVKVGGPQWEKK